VDEIDAVGSGSGLVELQPVLDAGEHREDMLQQMDVLQDVEVLTPTELKVNNIAHAAQPVHLTKKVAGDVAEPVMKPSSVKVKTGASSSLLRWLLKYSLPLPLLLCILLGGLYLLFDSWHEALSELGLLINPQLRHVRGAPPV